MRAFHLGDLLTVTTGRLVAPAHMGGLHALLDYMTGDTLFTHQLVRAADECRPALLAQYPFLSAIEPPEFRDAAHVEQWLAEMVAAHGAEFEVAPLAPEDHTHVNPLAEMAMMAPHMKVITVTLGDES